MHPFRISNSPDESDVWTTKADLTIDRAEAIDAEALTDLLHAAYAELAAAGLNFSASYQTEVRTRQQIAEREVYLLRHRGELIGTVTLRVRADNHGPHLYVNALAVRPSAQGRGFGRYLLDQVESHARARGLLRVRLDTAKPARDLIAFYERCGFTVVQEVHWEGKTYDSVVMEKKLG